MRWFMFGGFAVMGLLTRQGHVHSDQPKTATSDISALLQLNITNLRGADIDRLQGLRMSLAGNGSAVFETKDFSVDGNSTMHKDDSGSMFAQGDLSFKIPGLDVSVEGSFVFPNQTSAHEKTKTDFEKILSLLQQEVPHAVPDIEHVISSIAKAISAEHASDDTKDAKAALTGQDSSAAKVNDVGLGPRTVDGKQSVQKRQGPGHVPYEFMDRVNHTNTED